MLEELRRSEALEAAETELENPRETMGQLQERTEKSEVELPGQVLEDGQTSLFGDFSVKDELEANE